MKRIHYIAVIAIVCLSACQNTLDLYPLAQPSAEKWYSNEAEIQLALNDLYRQDFWVPDEGFGNEVLSDDAFYRTTLSPIKSGTTNSQWGTSTTLWRNSYKAIARANRALVALNSPETKANVPAAKLDIYIAEIRFHRALRTSRYFPVSLCILRAGDVWPDNCFRQHLILSIQWFRQNVWYSGSDTGRIRSEARSECVRCRLRCNRNRLCH